MSEDTSLAKHIVPNITLGSIIAYGSTSVVRQGKGGSGTQYAVKIVKISNSEAETAAKREAAIHRVLTHPHVIALRDFHPGNGYAYFVMDHAVNRELFSYIDPGRGMSDEISRLYLRQLLSALVYMHQRGICHRDIKPENILLDSNYNLRLADFGCATVYRDAKGRRPLTRQCGSTNYMAPEVFHMSYDGEKADVWSFGLLALVMWTGTVPWANACAGTAGYDKYKLSRDRDFAPFNVLSREKMEIIDRILCINESERVGFSKICQFPWFATGSALAWPSGLVKDPGAVASLLLPPEILALSQPDACVSPIGQAYSSQPVFMSYNDLPCATRIYAQVKASEALRILARTLDDVLIQYKRSGGSLSFTTVDGQKNLISGEIISRSIGSETLLIFQRTHGNCLEFKKMFNIVKDNFMEILESQRRH
ncbi:serine/threonine-protein kinase CHEK1 [Nematocida homosporus]|uniref:serine/threonine-protein kinase CHEK1 n=1 Tax=Nematocida homosporus TaxID=1912981 RepID=UPI00221ECFB9|nr:serine/threonine-protein kinase CHEK1 [Nematocida homosporus]KAI5185800.1 serine/threonine-protein kinase CHEK1 [Nematocida homosporus]